MENRLRDELLSPFKIGRVKLKNRMVMAPIASNFCAEDGSVTDRLINFYEERAKGGVSLIITEGTTVDISGKGHPRALMADDDRFIPGLRRLAGVVHKEGARIFLQLVHMGRCARKNYSGKVALAPSLVPSPLFPTPLKALEKEEIQHLIDAHGEAARRARKAGFDGVDIMGASGFLISQFLSPSTNHREDEYGGDLYHRMQFLLEVIASVRKRAGEDFPISVKIGVEDFMEGGNTLREGLKICRALEEAGVKALLPFVGWYESSVPVLQNCVPPGYFLNFTAKVKETVKIPVIANIRINDPELAAEIIIKGKADLVAFGRGLIADPYLPLKIAEGREEEIRKCIACNRCLDTGLQELPLQCSVNAEVGKEREYILRKVKRGKKVLVAGGGPGGLEAARIAAMRGHSVSLYEKSDQLGGLLNLAHISPFKEEIRNILTFLKGEVKRKGVKVYLSQEVTFSLVKELRPDVVVVATGATPIMPSSLGISSTKPLFALDVLRKKVGTGKEVLIIGGGMVGIETGEFLAEQGKKVTIVEKLDRIGMDLGASVRWTVLKRVADRGIQVLTGSEVKEIQKREVIVTVDKRRNKRLVYDTIVLALGLEPENGLAKALKDRVPELYIIGDAREPRQILEAIHEGAQVGREI